MGNMKQIPSLSYLHELNEYVDLQDMARTMRTLRLDVPEFVLAELPPRKPTVHIIYKDGKFSATNSDKVWDNLEAVYGELKGSKNFKVLFDSSVATAPGVEDFFGISLSVPVENGNHRLLMEDLDPEDVVASEYLNFLIAFKAWEESKTPARAWNFLNHHPAFYRIVGTEKLRTWSMEDGLGDMSISYYEEDGESHAHISTGPSNETDGYRSRYADLRLEACKPTLDEALVELADLVYSIYGISREEV